MLADDDVIAAHFTSHAVGSSNGGDAITDKYVLSPSSGNFYFLKDSINSVTDVVDQNGAVIQRNDFTSFGEIKSTKNADGNIVSVDSAPIRVSFKFTGREYEPELGIYYYRARMYDPTLGRFMQQDPDPGRLDNPITATNKYTYVGNLPNMRTDPSGKNWLGDALVFVVAFSVAVIAGPFIAALILGSSGGFAMFC